MTQIRYGNLDLTDVVYNELAFYDTIRDEGNESLGSGDGVLNDEEITHIGNFDAAAGLDALRGILKPYGYNLVESQVDAEETYLVKPEMDCPDGQRYIPDGVFEMGSENGQSDEQPVHEVGVSGFCADETETTNSPFSTWVATVPEQKPQPRFEAKEVCTTESKTVAATTAEAAKAKAKSAGVDASKTNCEVQVQDQTPRVEVLANNSPSGFDGADQPVVRVDWKTAAAYCASRTDLTGEPMRLPTEAEQERMAKGVSGEDAFATDDGTLSPEKANYYSSDVDKTAPVASFPENSFGLHDVAGNVWEWGADWYGPYSEDFQQNPTGPENGNYRILRGGSWYNYGDGLRSSDRDGHSPGNSNFNVGFRCVSAPRTPEE